MHTFHSPINWVYNKKEKTHIIYMPLIFFHMENNSKKDANVGATKVNVPRTKVKNCNKSHHAKPDL